MISSLEELRRAKELLAESQAELFKEGLEHNPNIEVGIMVEVPSAVWLAPRLARGRFFLGRHQRPNPVPARRRSQQSQSRAPVRGAASRGDFRDCRGRQRGARG